MLYKELDEAVESVCARLDQTDEFKRRFKKLIENSLNNSNLDEDLTDVLDLIKL